MVERLVRADLGGEGHAALPGRRLRPRDGFAGEVVAGHRPAARGEIQRVAAEAHAGVERRSGPHRRDGVDEERQRIAGPAAEPEARVPIQPLAFDRPRAQVEHALEAARRIARVDARRPQAPHEAAADVHRLVALEARQSARPAGEVGPQHVVAHGAARGWAAGGEHAGRTAVLGLGHGDRREHRDGGEGRRGTPRPEPDAADDARPQPATPHRSPCHSSAASPAPAHGPTTGIHA